MVAKAELSDPALFEIQAEEALKLDQKYLYWKYQLDQAEIIADADSSEHQRRLTRLEQRSPARSGTASGRPYTADFKKKMVRELQNKPNVPLQQLTQRFKTNFSSMQQQLAMSTKTLETKKKELQKRNERSVDLETRGEELKQLQQIANDMNAKLESLDIEKQVPAQIRQVQEAVPTKNINTTQHYAIAILGGSGRLRPDLLGYRVHGIPQSQA